ncbi:hypothetical protein BC828DRAFT_392894 [Blastocladiella britannica]|nr:hypothetical protein BC828DRAFT_392894 [Blastocladiella britannica]
MLEMIAAMMQSGVEYLMVAAVRGAAWAVRVVAAAASSAGTQGTQLAGASMTTTAWGDAAVETTEPAGSRLALAPWCALVGQCADAVLPDTTTTATATVSTPGTSARTVGLPPLLPDAFGRGPTPSTASASASTEVMDAARAALDAVADVVAAADERTLVADIVDQWLLASLRMHRSTPAASSGHDDSDQDDDGDDHQEEQEQRWRAPEARAFVLRVAYLAVARCPAVMALVDERALESILRDMFVVQQGSS